MSGYYTWPSNILPPEPLNAQYVLTPPNGNVRNAVDQGPAVQYQQWSNPPGTFDVVWPMTPTQKFIFDGLLANQIKDGWFEIPVFNNLDYETMVVRIVAGSMKPTRQGGEWMISCQLEAMTVPLPSSDSLGAAMIVYGSDDDLSTLTDRLHTIVHTDYPAAMGGY